MRVGLLLRFASFAFLAASTASGHQSPFDPATILKSQREQTAQLAASWLHSGEPRLQAWGAYVVLRDKHNQFIPDLLALVDAYEATGLPILGTRREQNDAMLAVLDTLIQLDAPISGDGGKKLYSEFPTQSLILLSRAWIHQDSLNSSNSILLEIFRSEHSQPYWLAAGNILAERRAEGFAATVLGNFTVHMNLVVTSPHGLMGGFGESACGDSLPGTPEDRSTWPEIGTYALAEPGPSVTLLADGADPAYYKRKVGRVYGNIEGGGQCSNVIANSWDLLRQHYVARMLGESRENPPLKATVYKSIIWENGRVYLEQLREFVMLQQQAFAETASKLRDDCLMTADEFATAKPHWEITIVDERADKTTPLPRAENLGENVIVKM